MITIFRLTILLSLLSNGVNGVALNYCIWVVCNKNLVLQGEKRQQCILSNYTAILQIQSSARDMVTL